MRTFPILLGLALATAAWGSEASRLYSRARKAEKAGRIAQAYLLYSEAAALEPNNRLYWSHSLALQSRAALESKVMPPVAAAAALALDAPPAPEAEPEPEPPALVAATAEDWMEARKPMPPTRLDAQPGEKDFNLRANAKSLFQTVAHAFGLECVFDGDYQSTQTIHFQMDQADYRTALHGLEAVTGSFLVPISGKLFLVVKDTPQKRKDDEPFAAIVVPLPEPTTPQDLTAMITAVQQSCGIQKVAWDSQKNVVVMRDSVAKVVAAQQLFKQLLYPRPQVLIEMNFVEVTESDVLNYGLSIPTSFPIVSFSNFMNNVPKIAQNVTGMLRFGGGAGLIGIGIANLQLVASLSKSNARNLLHATARSIEGQPASIHVGQKYPIETAGYFGPASFSGPNAYQPPPSFNFEDLGLSLKATPHIHGNQEVTLSIEAEFKLLAGQALNGIPVISNRSLKSDVRLKMDEWAVVAGLVDDEEARTIAGLAGVAGIPILGPLTGSRTRHESTDRVIIMLRPTLLTAPPDDSVTQFVRIGTETRPLTPL